jgi:hypothetical protein
LEANEGEQLASNVLSPLTVRTGPTY